MLSQTDLQLQHGFRIGARQLQLTFNVLNLFNQDTAVSKFSNYHRLNGVSGSSAFGANALDEDLFYSGQQTLAQLIEAQGVIKHPAFLMDNGFQAPIQARIGVKFIF
jgi:hypothetical protein